MFKLFRRKVEGSEPPAVSEEAAPTALAVERPQRDWIDDLSDEERDHVIGKVAQGVVKRGMETPAILFLEMHKPVSFFASQSLVILSPFTAPFIGMDNVQVASKLMEKRENVELLIRRIEELSIERDATRTAAHVAAKAAKKNGGRDGKTQDPSLSEPT